jgi:hypothetical protein
MVQQREQTLDHDRALPGAWQNIFQDLLNQAVGPVHSRNAGKPVNRFSFSFGLNFL